MFTGVSTNILVFLPSEFLSSYVYIHSLHAFVAYIIDRFSRGRGRQVDVNLIDEDWVEDAVVLWKKSDFANYLQRLDDIVFYSRTLFIL